METTYDNLKKTQRLVVMAGGVVTLLLLGWIYHQIAYEMFQDWMNDENYSHGLLVPFISAYFIWNKKETLKQLPIEPSFLGLGLVGFGIVSLCIGVLASELFTQRTSLIILLMGLSWAFLGTQWFKALFFPLAFLILMAPLPYILYDTIAFPLKLLATKVATAALHSAGVLILSEGNIIYLPNITLEVADACSGIRSLMSLVTLAIVLGYFSLKSAANRVILTAMAVPVAIATNSMRIIITGFLADRYGSVIAEGFFHEFEGIIIFASAFFILIAIAYLLKKSERRLTIPQQSQ